MYAWLRWLVHCDPFTLSLHLMAHVILDFGPRDYACTGEVLAFESLCGGAGGNNGATTTGGAFYGSHGAGRISVEEVKAQYGITTSAPKCVLFLVMYCAVGHTVAFTLLQRRCAKWLG
jgi:hypothetical protein